MRCPFDKRLRRDWTPVRPGYRRLRAPDVIVNRDFIAERTCVDSREALFIRASRVNARLTPLLSLKLVVSTTSVCPATTRGSHPCTRDSCSDIRAPVHVNDARLMDHLVADHDEARGSG